jgi:hypothetical protein
LTHSIAIALSGQALHAKKVAAVFDADVVGGGISPGLGDFEAAAHGLRHKLQFDPLATNFEVFETLTLRHVLRAFFFAEIGTKKGAAGGLRLILLKFYSIFTLYHNAGLIAT